MTCAPVSGLGVRRSAGLENLLPPHDVLYVAQVRRSCANCAHAIRAFNNVSSQTRVAVGGVQLKTFTDWLVPRWLQGDAAARDAYGALLPPGVASTGFASELLRTSACPFGRDLEVYSSHKGFNRSAATANISEGWLRPMGCAPSSVRAAAYPFSTSAGDRQAYLRATPTSVECDRVVSEPLSSPACVL